jgi:tetratricopeptide (TPR) repeat protein
MAIPPALARTLSSLRNTLPVTEIELAPLTPLDTAALAQHISGHQPTATQLHQLYQETEGNPLFVEEMVRAGLSQSIEKLSGPSAEVQMAPAELPPRIQAVIETRLAQLSSTARELANVAAVVGREFTFEILVAATNSDEETLVRGLDELWEYHLIREQHSGAYDFSHDKIREVVYGGLNSARKHLLHRRVGTALAAVHTGDLIAASGQAAAHFEKGHSLDQAYRYYMKAASQAAALYAYYTAQELYRHAIELAQKLNLPGQQLVEIYLACGRMLEFAGRFAEAVEVYRALEQLGRVRHDQKLEAAALVQLIKCYQEPYSVHDPAQAAPLLQRGLALAQQLRDPDLESQLLWSQMVYASHYGSDEEAQAAGEASIALARRHGLHERLAYVLNDLAINLLLSGQRERGQACAAEAKALFEQMNNLPMLADNLSQQAYDGYHALHFAPALAAVADCIRLSREIHNGWNLALATLVRGAVRYAQGEWGEALVDLEASRHYGEEGGLVVALALAPSLMGALLREIGDLDGAMTLHRQAHALSTQQAPFLLPALEAQLAMDAFAGGQVAEGRNWLQAMQSHPPRGAIARAWFTLGDAAAATVAGAAYSGAWSNALHVVEKAQAEAEQRHLPVYEPGLEVHRARCLAMLDRQSEAVQRLNRAIATAQTVGLRPILWQAHGLLADLHHGQGRNAEATSHATAAAHAIDEIANSLAEPIHRDSFLARPSVTRYLSTGS